MANEVFANGLEVACKAADGVSSAAFPDVCFTPKYPVPFANTAFAKDTKNGSKTVLISGKEVVLKDYSYIKTSSGDNAAKGKKGFSTSAKNGKAYFRSWSMNVKVEGYNVCRHTDKMTHNHGSDPGNTGGWVYLDEASLKKNCGDEKKKMDKACGIDKEEQDDYKERKDRVNSRRKKKNKVPYKIRNKTWKDNHCMGHLIKPGLSEEDIEKNLKELEKNMDEFIQDIKDDIPSTVADKAIDKALDMDNLISCSRLRFPWLIAACKAGSIAYSGYEGAKEILDKIDNIENIKQQAEAVKKAKENITNIGEGMLSEEQIEEKLAKNQGQLDMANAQEKMAQADPCLNARKCMLTPYNKKQEESMDKANRLKPNNAKGTGKKDFLSKVPFSLDNAYGCCPGQTGHHLIPKSWAKENCPDYDEDKAPVVCAEGTSHSTGGSHAKLHTGLNKELGRVVEDKLAGTSNNGTLTEKKVGLHAYSQKTLDVGKETERVISAGTLTKKETIRIAAKSHEEAFGKDCSEKCIKAQLEAFHKDCKYPFKAKTIGSGVPTEGSGTKDDE